MFKKIGFMVAGAVFVFAPFLTQAATLYRELEVGMSGSDVSAMQTWLARDSSLYPQGLVTGYFGFLTKAAVSNFQSRNGISAVGRVGPQTLPVLNAQMAGGGTVGVGDGGRAPRISNVGVAASSNSARITWVTDEAAAGLIYYSPNQITMQEASGSSDVNISGTSLLVSTSLQMMHDGTITGLMPNAIYNYVIYTRDGQGNVSVTWPSAFRTTN